jgi:hypothetical protein
VIERAVSVDEDLSPTTLDVFQVRQELLEIAWGDSDEKTVARPSRCRVIHVLLNKARARWFRPMCWQENLSNFVRGFFRCRSLLMGQFWRLTSSGSARLGLLRSRSPESQPKSRGSPVLGKAPRAGLLLALAWSLYGPLPRQGCPGGAACCGGCYRKQVAVATPSRLLKYSPADKRLRTWLL